MWRTLLSVTTSSPSRPHRRSRFELPHVFNPAATVQLEAPEIRNKAGGVNGNEVAPHPEFEIAGVKIYSDDCY